MSNAASPQALEYHAEIFTGVRPTRGLTVGNYIGAVGDIVDLQREHHPVIFVADLHGLTDQDPKTVQEHRASMLGDYVALGLDLDQSSIYMQSHIAPELGAMTLLLSRGMTLNGLIRVPTTKDKLVEEVEGSEAVRVIDGANMMFALYPILMAADILAMRSHYVPVGQDQRAHIEVTRDLAQNFNRIHGPTFPMPQQWGVDEGRKPLKVLALQDIDGMPAKMSKSHPQTALLFTDPPEQIARKVGRAQTGNLGEVTDHIRSLQTIGEALSDGYPDGEEVARDLEDMITSHRDGERVMSDFKQTVGRVAARFIGDFQVRREAVDEHPKDILDALTDGNAKAQRVARETLEAMYERMGLSSSNIATNLVRR